MTTQYFDFTAARKREEEFDRIIEPAVQTTTKEMGLLLGDLKVWGGHFGATGIDPKYLFVYLVLPTRNDVINFKESGQFVVARLSLFNKLEAGGYPVSTLQENWINVFSEQECQEEANGNWYYFFK